MSLLKITHPQKWLKDWLFNPLVEEDVENFKKKDSCKLSKVVCVFFRRKDWDDLENPSKRAEIFQIAIPLGKKYLDLLTPIIDSMLSVYNKAIEAIMGCNLAATESKENGSSRYYVIPKDFVDWVDNNKEVKKLIKNILKPDKEKQVVEMLVDLSNHPECQNKLFANQIMQLEPAKLMLDSYLKGFPGNLENKWDKIERKLRNHPNFGGKRRPHNRQK